MTSLLQDATPAATGLFADQPSMVRVLAIAGVALLLHLAVRGLRRVGEWIVTPASSPTLTRELFERRQPRLATITTLFVSGATFSIYFVAIGLILAVFEISLTAYFASATVIGLAVAFGSQGLVQDVVIGITLVFSDAINVGDVVEISGQVGRVDRIGLRFTTLTNFQGQTVYIPNRNIGLIGRFRRGAVRVYVDVQLTTNAAEDDVARLVRRLANGLRAQHPAILLTPPDVTGPFDAAPGDWRYIRVKFRVWPGQGVFLEGAFRQRLLASLRQLDPEYADWMVTIAYRATA
jgi:moderate conductance mechanosensitive channel